MKLAMLAVTLLGCAATLSAGVARSAAADLYPDVARYVQSRIAEIDEIDEARREKLDALASYVRERRSSGEPVRLLFVCTHNSRRSHMSMIWAAVAAEHFGIDVQTTSGGTEWTAFYPRAVAALERACLRIEQSTDAPKPIYHVRMGESPRPLTCFSKIYDQAPNPREEFAAIMVCAEADEACPSVPGAAERFAIAYVDPKAHDDTPREARAYDERCAQIAREFLYVFQQAAN